MTWVALSFWLAWILLCYTYLGYPLLIIVMSRLSSRLVLRDVETWPTISVVLAARNEAHQLVRKIENLRALDTHSPLEIVIVDNGSTDHSAAVLAKFPDVVTLFLEPGQGKAAAVNAGITRASGELVLFCDARQEIAEDVLLQMVPCFTDPNIGAVSGELQLGTDKGPGMYWRYERAIRAAEARVDSVVGATGALYMIRRALFHPIPPHCLLDDVYIPMQIVMQGFRVWFETKAKVFDQEVALQDEFQRKARTLAGNFQLVEVLPGLLSPRKNRVWWAFYSHKLSRLLCPYALLLLFIANVALCLLGEAPRVVYLAMLVGQVFCYSAALVYLFMPGGQTLGRVGRLCSTFLTLHAAAVVGLWRYLRRDFSWTGSGTMGAREEETES